MVSTTASITARESTVLIFRAAAATIATRDHRRFDSSRAPSCAPICCLTSWARKLANSARRISMANENRTLPDGERVPVSQRTAM